MCSILLNYSSFLKARKSVLCLYRVSKMKWHALLKMSFTYKSYIRPRLIIDVLVDLRAVYAQILNSWPAALFFFVCLSYLRGALLKRSKFANCCHNLTQKLIGTSYMHLKFYSVQRFNTPTPTEKFHFSHRKMIANYAKVIYFKNMKLNCAYSDNSVQHNRTCAVTIYAKRGFAMTEFNCCWPINFMVEMRSWKWHSHD